MRERLTDLAYAAGWSAVKALPAGLASQLFELGAERAVNRGGRGVRQLEANLRRVVGGEVPPELLRAAMRSYARYWLETFRLPVMDREAIYAAADRHPLGVDNLDKAYAEGRGVILVLPHMANWDIAAVWLVKHGMPFTTVVERLRPESLFRRFVAFRQSIGMEVLPLTGGARPAAEVLADRLRAGRVIALVGDRDLSRSGVPVSFFGEPATMPPGPALLAIRTGAALLPAGLWFDGPSWIHHIHPPVPTVSTGRMRDRVVATTQAVADVFAADIAEHPADWHMLQRLWLADLDPAGAPTGGGVAAGNAAAGNAAAGNAATVRGPSGDLGGG